MHTGFQRVIGALGVTAVLTATSCGGNGSGGDERCGDGLVTAAEQCDDGNAAAGDGCDSQCAVEAGWTCDATPSVCVSTCGDGLVVSDELCDDGNLHIGDGCDSQCGIEPGWYCDGASPSVCVTDCGDDLVAGVELCDGSAMGGETCASLGLGGGTLGCGPDCLFEVSGCAITATCGNTAREYPEDCDATDLAGQTCTDLGFPGGMLACAADCTFDTSDCDEPPVCGDGVIEGDEACDGAALGGETCQSQGWDSGDLACASDCTFDYADCQGTGPQCGDGVRQGGESCDGTDLGGSDCTTFGFAGGVLLCTAACAFDTTGCTQNPTCGNGTRDAGEACDGGDLGGQDCAGLGHTGGTLGCTITCTYDESGCVDCGPGLTLCGAVCVDLVNDPAYCGDCVTACTSTQTCVGGQCTQPNLAWVDVGTQPLGPGTAHDLATDGAQPAVAYTRPVSGGPMAPQVIIQRYAGVPAWDTLGGNPAQSLSQLNSAVALTYVGAVPHVLFSGTDWMTPPNVHLHSLQGNAWLPSVPPWTSACSSHERVAMAFDGTTPHITTFGAGGCGIGIDYAWHDGTAWQSHPSATSHPAQLSDTGIGYPDIVFTDQAYVGLAETAGMIMTAEHTVRYWDTGNGAWTPLVGPLDENNNFASDEHMSLTADAAGNLYAAWSEGTPGGGSRVYVKRFDVATATWDLVGGPPEATQNAYEPSITLIGAAVWITYATDTGIGAAVIVVKRFDPATATWEQVGTALTDGTPRPPGHEPVIVGIAGIPYVAFRVGDSMTLQETVWVQHYVPVP
jgi:cysteine-rich repeat protein